MPFEIAVINDREKIEAHLNDGWEPFAATTSMVPTEYVGKPAGGIELVHVVFLRRVRREAAPRPVLDLGRFVDMDDGPAHWFIDDTSESDTCAECGEGRDDAQHYHGFDDTKMPGTWSGPPWPCDRCGQLETAAIHQQSDT